MRSGHRARVVQLVPVPAEDLPALVQGSVPERLAGRAIADGLLPPHVAARIQSYLAAGKPARWVSMCYIVDADGCYIGGCGFKDVPRDREVEVGYGLAAARRGQGYASAALSQLIHAARTSGELDTLFAHISPDNRASTQLATRAGFVPGERALDEGEWVVRYRLWL